MRSESKKKGVYMYAVIQTGGKQYRVAPGDIIYVEKLGVSEGEQVTFDQVFVIGDETVTYGNPTIEGATVTGTVQKNGKGKKITVFTYKAKKNEHRKMGHRQPYTKIQIEAINK